MEVPCMLRRVNMVITATHRHTHVTAALTKILKKSLPWHMYCTKPPYSELLRISVPIKDSRTSAPRTCKKIKIKNKK
jgi:hypothetical protein